MATGVEGAALNVKAAMIGELREDKNSFRTDVLRMI